MAKNYRYHGRQRDIEAVGHLYKKKFGWLNTCVYCGMNAIHAEHVLPISVCARLDFDKIRMSDIKQGLYIVPSCSECNIIAQSTPFFSVKEKRKYIQKKLKKKYRTKLRHVEWEEHEIKELGRAMRDQVRQSMYNKFILTKRVNYPAFKEFYDYKEMIK